MWSCTRSLLKQSRIYQPPPTPPPDIKEAGGAAVSLWVFLTGRQCGWLKSPCSFNLSPAGHSVVSLPWADSRPSPSALPAFRGELMANLSIPSRPVPSFVSRHGPQGALCPFAMAGPAAGGRAHTTVPAPLIPPRPVLLPVTSRPRDTNEAAPRPPDPWQPGGTRVAPWGPWRWGRAPGGTAWRRPGLRRPARTRGLPSAPLRHGHPISDCALSVTPLNEAL